MLKYCHFLLVVLGVVDMAILDKEFRKLPWGKYEKESEQILPSKKTMDKDGYSKIPFPGSWADWAYERWDDLGKGFGLKRGRVKADAKAEKSDAGKPAYLASYGNYKGVEPRIRNYGMGKIYSDAIKRALKDYGKGNEIRIVPDLYKMRGEDVIGYEHGNVIEVERGLPPREMLAALTHEGEAKGVRARTGKGHYEVHDEIMKEGKDAAVKYLMEELAAAGL